MKILEKDAELFYDLMWPLQYYVNMKLSILPKIKTIEEYLRLPISEKLKVRDALFDHIELIDTYLAENLKNLATEELDIIKSWKQFRRGDFYIERFLKKYTVFIGGEQVYAVLALQESFEEILPYESLPYYAQVVLLPFKGQIIYDGILQGYSIIFGSGIKSDLKETYMAAKQNGRIIESFDPIQQATKAVGSKNAAKDLSPTIDEISQQATKLRSSRDAPAIHNPAFSMVKASIEFAKLAIENPDDVDNLWKALKKAERAIRKAATVLNRSE